MPELPEPPGAARPGDVGPARPFDVSPAAAGFPAGGAGEQPGSGMFHHLLSPLPVGAHLHDSLSLGAGGAIAFWPLAAGLVAGGLEAFATRDQRRRRGAVGTPLLAGPGGAQAWPPGPPPGQPRPTPGSPGG